MVSCHLVSNVVPFFKTELSGKKKQAQSHPFVKAHLLQKLKLCTHNKTIHILQEQIQIN